MKKEKKRRIYTGEFKAIAVKITLKPGVSVSEVAAQLDIPPTYILQWRSEMQEQQGIAAAKSRVDGLAENRRLEDEIERLKMELEILKKAPIDSLRSIKRLGLWQSKVRSCRSQRAASMSGSTPLPKPKGEGQPGAS